MHSSVPQQAAKGHSWPLALGEITAQDTEGKGVSSRASLSLRLYLKQHPPNLNAVGFVTLQSSTLKEMEDSQTCQVLQEQAMGSTGGVQDREWLHTTAGSRQGRVLRRQPDE